MGYADIGPYGATDIRTPRLDRLSREGVRLTDAYATAPICTPSRVALLTGRYQQRAGIERNSLKSDATPVGLGRSEVTLARLLRDRGYATAAVGKWHLGFGPESSAVAHGFDSFFGFLDWSIDYYSHRTISGEPGLFEDAAPVERAGYTTDLFTDTAIRFIGAHASREPFFLYLSYNAALPPMQRPGRPQDVRQRETWHASTREDYVQVVEALDAGVGRVLAALEEAGAARNTIVVFTYDHGGANLSSKRPLFHGFGTLWEGGIRVPCLIRWPERLPRGAVSSQPAILMDVTASVLATAGSSPAPDRPLDGIDLFAILAGKAPPRERTFFWRMDSPVRKQKAIRRGHWKYVRDGNADLLFDVVGDPGERDDVIYKHPEVVTRLRAALAEWEAQMPPPPAP
jgi:arylsulfatase A-like enzyme